MDKVHVERLDHLGVLASVSKDFGLIDMINARLVPDPQEGLTPGEAMAGLILTGLGFANRPLSLTPQFFASNPLDRLLHDGIRAEMVHRFQLGRTRDEAYASGCDLLFHELALCVCARDGLDLRFTHLDTPSFSLTGEYVPDSDEQAIPIPHGYSRDHRPDLQQAVLELMGSQDGGIPFVSQRWDGHTSDIEIFQARPQALLAAFQSAPSPRDLMADSKLYHEDNSPHLHPLDFITRLPTTIGAVSEAITQALALDSWARLDEETRYQRLALGHYGIAQRWLVGSSQAALERAAATLHKARQRADEAIHKQLLHLQAQRFTTPEAAQEALPALAKGWTYHLVDSSSLSDHKRYARKGRPTPSTPVKAIEWQIQAHVRPQETAIGHQKQYHACVVIGTNIGASVLGDTEVIAADKRQSRVEGGFRLLNDPLGFGSSLFVKKPCRIPGLLMVMTLAWLVSSVAQRRWRQHLAHHHATVPNPINQPTTSPTLRWVFQLLEGMHRVRVPVQGQGHDLSEGLNDVQGNVLRLCGEEGCRLYQISPGEGCSMSVSGSGSGLASTNSSCVPLSGVAP